MLEVGQSLKSHIYISPRAIGNTYPINTLIMVFYGCVLCNVYECTFVLIKAIEKQQKSSYFQYTG